MAVVLSEQMRIFGVAAETAGAVAAMTARIAKSFMISMARIGYAGLED